MVKIIDGVAKKVLPWYSISSANGSIVFAPPEGRDYLMESDINITAEMLDTFYTETADVDWGNWTGSNFILVMHGAEDDYLNFVDEEIEGLTLEEIAKVIYETALEWFDDVVVEEEN